MTTATAVRILPGVPYSERCAGRLYDVVLEVDGHFTAKIATVLQLQCHKVVMGSARGYVVEKAGWLTVQSFLSRNNNILHCS